MNSRALRRLAADHGALHNEPLPPNYLFPTDSSNEDDITQLDILLAGPTHTPFAGGVWKLHFAIPTNYPQQPPTANFRTPIFHPNVDPQTGGVCVETLKRDWDTKLTLRDVLITITCLLIQPNPDSALNAEAGALIQEDYEAYSRRASLMTSIHAGVPKRLIGAVAEAQDRGQVTSEDSDREQEKLPQAPARRRRTTARQRGTAASRRSEGSPSGAAPRRRPQAGPSRPFAIQKPSDDIFGSAPAWRDPPDEAEQEEESSILTAEQENDLSKPSSHAMPPPAKPSTPRRAPGPTPSLGDLSIDEAPTSPSNPSDSETSSPEYPPSPRKSPTKTPAKRPARPDAANTTRTGYPPTSARGPVHPTRIFTPPNAHPHATRPLAPASPFASTPAPAVCAPRGEPPRSPSKSLFSTAAPARGALFATPPTRPVKHRGGVVKRSPSSEEKRREARRERAKVDEKLWKACGEDVRKWNRGEFRGAVELGKGRGGRW